ncbi:hypothetical protein BDV23DRAFT_182729 [Aspergillus alliaceus]|uniref:Uncharacterized protein n=1 Tax=Petromyces alliaceus TaxID=209559 RepID=A0A5N7CBR3_PETAA|nr:hypothetical protein BDV23DRAFT_182729 [Aspergillus alliaceus]
MQPSKFWLSLLAPATMVMAEQIGTQYTDEKCSSASTTPVLRGKCIKTGGEGSLDFNNGVAFAFGYASDDCTGNRVNLDDYHGCVKLSSVSGVRSISFVW